MTLQLVQKEIKEVYLGTTKVRPSWRLPSWYQEVEYIQSSGTQYIDSWFTPSNTTKVEWEMWWWTESWSHQMFWVRYSWSSSTWVSSDRWFAIVTDAYQYGWHWSITHWMTDWSIHTWELSQSWLYVDWALKWTPSTVTFTCPGSLYLFWLNWNWSIAERASLKYYSFKIYDNTTLIRDFVPCYRTSDNEIWLYDLVNDVFYTNSGSWTFTKWPDVD